MHWANLLNGGAGLLMIEATAVTPQGRITPNCLGMWDDQTAQALSDTLNRARKLAPPMPVCLQIAHSGRKGSSAQPWHGGMMIDKADGGWDTAAPSPLALLPGEAPPHEIDASGLQAIEKAFVDAAKRAQHMGLEMIELHGAHGNFCHPSPTNEATTMVAILKTASAFHCKFSKPCAWCLTALLACACQPPIG
jgi:2,4-dienoyl-CoA reductase-like NADH-dependent reductase (Old Yellow Enzyme family)